MRRPMRRRERKMKEKIGVEIEKKYIIAMPIPSEISVMDSYTVSEIVQTYIEGAPNETHRVRMRKDSRRTVYYETRKIRIDKMSSTEIEREITESEYDSLVKTRIPDTRPIVKTRYTFLYLGQLFEIDVYPEWKSTAIMETELDSRDRAVEMPSCIKILREVTGDKSYSNAAMSRLFPKEDHL